GDERRILDLDPSPLDRCREHERAVVLAPQHRREELHERMARERRALMVPGAVARDPDLEVLQTALRSFLPRQIADRRVLRAFIHCQSLTRSPAEPAASEAPNQVEPTPSRRVSKICLIELI